MLIIQNFIFNPFLENTYILFDSEKKDAVVIDPGCYGEEEENEISNFIEKEKIKLKYLINTHCHIDHILGNNFIKRKYNPKFFIPKEDEFLLLKAKEQAEMFGFNLQTQLKPDDYLNEDLKIKIGNEDLNFIFTPGHTPGEFSIYIKSFSTCFTGDVLFKNGIGRTDLWGGNYDTLINSIQNKLFVLPDETIIYPGHGEKSTIGNEKKNSIFSE